MIQPFTAKHCSILAAAILLISSPRILVGLQQMEAGTRLWEAGEMRQASLAFASSAARLPWHPNLWGLAGQASFHAGGYEEAIQWFEEGEEHNGLDQAGWLTYGDTWAALDNLQAASQVWEKGIILAGPSTESYGRLAFAARQAGDLQASIAYLQQAIQLTPNDPRAHFQLGLLLAATDPFSALPELITAGSLDPSLESAAQEFRSKVNQASLENDKAFLLMTCGQFLASLGEWDLAAEAFRSALGFNPEYAEAWGWLGESLQQNGSDGRAELDLALQLNPESAGVQALDGLYWLRHGDPQKAQMAFEKAVNEEPENPYWHISLGDAKSAAGDLLTASQQYHLAVELDPQNPAGWRALALFCLDHDSDVENTGLTATRNLLKLAPDEWLTFDIAGQTATRLGAYQEAESHLLMALDLASEEPAVHFHLALCYIESGQFSLAYDKLMDTVNLDPEGSYGWQANRILEGYFP